MEYYSATKRIKLPFAAKRVDLESIVKSLQLCPTLCDPIDHSLPDFSVDGILWSLILV